MTIEAWFTLGTIALVIAALIATRVSVDVAMVGGLTLLMVGDVALPGDIVSVESAVSGFAHPAIMLIGALFVVAAGLQETGGMEVIAQRMLGRPKSVFGAQLRLMPPVAIMSAFMNNTPIVAMYLPIISDWSKKLRISPSKLFIPLSFASILGGRMTYIGTATNIVLISLYLQYASTNSDWLQSLGVAPLTPAEQFWGIAWIGVPMTIVGILFIAATSKWLLPDRRHANHMTKEARQYQVWMVVQPNSPIVGKTIEQAGLRHLPGLYLTQIERDGEVLAAVGPDVRIEANDRLAFVGILDSVVDLRKIRGLVPDTDQVEKISARSGARTLVEAVVGRNSALVGKSVRASRFRTVYNAAIIAVHRAGQHVNKKVGDIVLQPGDTLLMETHHGFVNAYRNSDDFYLVSNVEGSRPIRHERAWIALAILGLLVVLFALTNVNQVVAAFFCAMAMIGTRCVTGTVARTSINWQVLLVIGAALGMGEALRTTGAAAEFAHGMMQLGYAANFGPHGMLAIIFAVAALFSQLINPNGAAVLMFPVAMSAAEELQVSPVPFVFMLMAAAGASFISPIAYQTNLMVYGPGGYRFHDFVRIGTPLTILVGIITILIAPLVFPFDPNG